MRIKSQTQWVKTKNEGKKEKILFVWGWDICVYTRGHFFHTFTGLFYFSSKAREVYKRVCVCVCHKKAEGSQKLSFRFLETYSLEAIFIYFWCLWVRYFPGFFLFSNFNFWNFILDFLLLNDHSIPYIIQLLLLLSRWSLWTLIIFFNIIFWPREFWTL